MAAAKYKMISIPEAQATVLKHAAALPTEVVPLASALGRILSQEVVAQEPLPPFPASIKDGYAVVAADGAGTYPVVGEARTGDLGTVSVNPGAVAYITTGAPVPSGADAVVQVEDTARTPGDPSGRREVVINKQVAAGTDIRPIGSDISQGERVLAAGELVGVAEVGILATVGAAQLPVYRRPLVAVLSTGDEVVDPCGPSPPGPGQIRDANRAMMLAAAAAAGAQTLDLGIARDVEGHLEGALEKALAAGADVLITSGGVSMGDRDLIKPLLERRGEVHFGRVLMKPGKPLTFATLPSAKEEGRTMLVFGLPGNPVSSFVCFHLVVAPALRVLGGSSNPLPRRVHALTTSPLKLDPERPEYHRVTLQYGRPPEGAGLPTDPVWFATTTGNQISSRLLSARSANALLELPRQAGVLPAGSKVSALLIDDLCHMPVDPASITPTPGFDG